MPKNLMYVELCATLLRDGKYARYGNRPINKKLGAVIDQMVADGLIVQTHRTVRVWEITDKGREIITWDSLKTNLNK